MPSISAPAKVNLTLHVTGRRDDGYHLLDSLTVFASDIADRIEIETAPRLSLDLSGPFAEMLSNDGIETNLAVKAVRAAARSLGQSDRLAISLEKNIPPGAGLGGGSADAAACVKLCEKMWGDKIPEAERRALLLSLGADVPVCDYGRPARFSGIGESIMAAPPLPRLNLLLIWPGVGVSTKDVFARRDGAYSDPAPIDDVSTIAVLLKYLEGSGNDLETAAISLCPAIGDAKAALTDSDGCMLARMSGSGAAVFGLFETERSCLAAREAISARHPGWWAREAMI